jgi:PII-like signaling protein
VVLGDAQLIRFCVPPSLRWRGKAVYRHIVESARRLGLAGTSVFGVEFSLGSDGIIHDACNDYSAADVPVIVEIVEAPDRIAALLGDLGELGDRVTATVEEVRVLRYSPHAGGSGRIPGGDHDP